MAYSAQFMAKIAEKPQHLTPSEKSRCFATMRGWELRSPQHDNERYKNMKTELIHAIPGLSMILDLDSAGGETLADRAATIDTATYMMNITDVGFNRRSRRRYSITVSLPERIFLIAQSPTPADVEFHLRGLVWDAEDTAGNPLTGLPATIPLEITGKTTDQTEIGRLVFDIPTFNADPGKVHVTIGGFEVYASSTQFTGNALVDETGRNYQGAKFDASAILKKVELVNPTTTDPR